MTKIEGVPATEYRQALFQANRETLAIFYETMPEETKKDVAILVVDLEDALGAAICRTLDLPVEQYIASVSSDCLPIAVHAITTGKLSKTLQKTHPSVSKGLLDSIPRELVKVVVIGDGGAALILSNLGGEDIKGKGDA